MYRPEAEIEMEMNIYATNLAVIYFHLHFCPSFRSVHASVHAFER
jgi:hypothetical protein